MKLARGDVCHLALTPVAFSYVGEALLSMSPDCTGAWSLRIEARSEVVIEAVLGDIEPPEAVGDLQHVVQERIDRAALLRSIDGRLAVTSATSVERIADHCITLGVDLAWALGRMRLSAAPRTSKAELATIADRAAATRRARRMTLARVARAAGVVDSTVSGVEAGSGLSLGTLERVAKALSVHPHSLAEPL